MQKCVYTHMPVPLLTGIKAFCLALCVISIHYDNVYTQGRTQRVQRFSYFFFLTNFSRNSQGFSCIKQQKLKILRVHLLRLKVSQENFGSLFVYCNVFIGLEAICQYIILFCVGLMSRIPGISFNISKALIKINERER